MIQKIRGRRDALLLTSGVGREKGDRNGAQLDTHDRSDKGAQDATNRLGSRFKYRSVEHLIDVAGMPLLPRIREVTNAVTWLVTYQLCPASTVTAKPLLVWWTH